jgi:hypothetical protein
MSKICPCPNPPGGHITCEDNQFGMCAYKDGKQVGGCQTPPSALITIDDRQERNLALINWVLSMLTGEAHVQDGQISYSEREMLRSGKFTGKDGVVILFSLPKDIDLDISQGASVSAY